MPTRILWYLAAVLAFARPAVAQLAPVPPPRLVLPAPAESPVDLRSVTVRTTITGSLALTAVEMVFHNPNRRVLEGELQFPLLDGQGVVGLAMDIDGKLRDAVPVDKARGQQVFEDVTRARIDPALLQVTQGNNYKLRVYPILPQKDKIVVLRYAETLQTRGGKQVYRLPLNYADKLDRFSLSVNVAGTVAAPVAAPGALGGLAFVRAGEGYAAEVTRQSFTGRGLLEIEVPAAQGAQAFTQAFDGKPYFYAEVPIASVKGARVLPRVVQLVWDSSGSGAARDHVRELSLLNAYFGKVRNAEVRLVRVRETAEPAQSFKVVAGDWRGLRRALEATAYDGATDLGAVSPEPGADEALLFTDGLSNFGAQRPIDLKVPVYTVSAATRADNVLLRHVADRSGGRFIDLVADTPAAAADKLLTTSSRIVAMEADGATQLVAASPFPVQGRLAIAGVLTESAGALRVTVAHPGGRQQVVNVPLRAGRNDSSLAASMWARLRVAELEGEYDLNRAEIRRLGRAFALVTRETSLIVLDRIEDYARYEIAPPSEFAAEYQRLRGLASQRQAGDRQAHLERIARLFAEKQAWWNRDFPKGDRPSPVAISKSADRLEERSARLDAPRAAQAPMPQSAPAAANAIAGRVAREMKDEAGTAAPAGASIQLRKWTPDAPYIARLNEAAGDALYRVYLDERPGYADSTAFFLDAADVFFEKGQIDLGVRVLSNLAEMDLENRHVLRILGYRLLQAGRPKLAIPVFRKVLELSPEEPQSYRDLGLAYAADGQRQKAIETLYEVVIRPWHGRFPEVELITLAELNAIVATAPAPLDTSRIDPRLLANLPLDLRVVLTWDADNTDIDLWVTDPNGERAFYGNRLTYQGGRMSQDFTGGYGPEEFSLKAAKPGKYKVEANFYGHRQQIVAGATTIQVKLATGFGTAAQREQLVTMRLKGRAEVVFVGEFEVR